MIFTKKTFNSSKESNIAKETIDLELKDLASSLQKLFSSELLMMALFGSLARGDFNIKGSDINILMVFNKINFEILKKINSVFCESKIKHMISPILLQQKELSDFAKAFPIKVLEIKRCYRILLGNDLLNNLAVDKIYLGLRCQQELRNMITKMRRFLALGSSNKHLLMSNFAGFYSYYISTLKAIAYLPNNDITVKDPVEAGLRSLKIDHNLIIKLNNTKKKDPDNLDLPEIETACSTFLDILEKSINELCSISELQN